MPSHYNHIFEIDIPICEIGIVWLRPNLLMHMQLQSVSTDHILLILIFVSFLLGPHFMQEF